MEKFLTVHIMESSYRSKLDPDRLEKYDVIISDQLPDAWDWKPKLVITTRDRTLAVTSRPNDLDHVEKIVYYY